MKKTAAFLAMLFVLFSACGGEKKEEPVLLPPTPVLEHQSIWAVNLTKYLRVRALPQVDSEPLTILAKGELLKIIERSLQKEHIGDNEDFWYKVEADWSRGWVYGSHLEIYSTKREAEKRQQELE